MKDPSTIVRLLSVTVALFADSSCSFIAPGVHHTHIKRSVTFDPKIVADVATTRCTLNLSVGKSDQVENGPSLRTRLRNWTGFSFTALRATLRATTGFSLTAARVAVGATLSRFVKGTMKTVIGIFPPWFRYFLQPFLIIYYTPLMIFQSLVGPSRNFWKDERASHQAFVDGWTMAVEKAEEAQKGGYWPVHVNEQTGIIEEGDGDVDIVDAVAESVEVSMSSDANDK